jgi:hypothetical protein
MSEPLSPAAADIKNLVEAYNEEVAGRESAYLESFRLDPVRVGALSRISTAGVPSEIPLPERGPMLWALGFAFGLFCADRLKDLRDE